MLDHLPHDMLFWCISHIHPGKFFSKCYKMIEWKGWQLFWMCLCYNRHLIIVCELWQFSTIFISILRKHWEICSFFFSIAVAFLGVLLRPRNLPCRQSIQHLSCPWLLTLHQPWLQQEEVTCWLNYGMSYISIAHTISEDIQVSSGRKMIKFKWKVYLFLKGDYLPTIRMEITKYMFAQY